MSKTLRAAVAAAPSLSEDMYRGLVGAVMDYAVCRLDPEGRVVSWNTGARNIEGYTAEEIVGAHISRFYTQEDRQDGAPEAVLKAARERGRCEAQGWRVRKDGGLFWAEVVVDAIWDEQGELLGYAKIVRDITAWKEDRLQLEETRRQLAQSQKMDAIGQLTGGVAHDFNNLLTIIVGGVEMARRRTDDPRRLGMLLDNIGEAAEQGGKLSKHLLAFARRQPASPETFALMEMLPEFVELLDRSLGGDIAISLEIADDACIHADRHQLELALLSAGLNARAAMPGGGRIAVKAERRRLNEQVGGLCGDFVAISVSDVGAGVPSDLLERVFEPLFAAREEGQGAGLSLSQAYGFAQQSGGGVQIQSEAGRGATVTFLLPEAERAALPAPPQNDAITLDLSGRRILVVEDDAAVAEVACSMLEEAGAHVACAQSVREALEALDRTSFDLVFSDVVMPGGRNGFDLARQLGRDWPELPVILATGYGGAAASQASEFEVLSKPYGPADLFQSIANRLAA